MNRLVAAALGVLWFGVVFFLTFYFTFPSDAIKERIRWEVHEGSDGAYTLELDSVSPWWVGLALHDVRLFTKGRDPETREMTDQLAFLAGRVRARSTIGSLMAQTPAVNGSVDLLDGGSVEFEVETAMNKKGTRLELTRVLLDGPGLPIAELGASAGVVGSGEIDLLVDIEAPDGLRSADGKITLKSAGLSLTELGDAVPSLGFEIPIDAIDIEFDVNKGKARAKRGNIESGFGKVELEGDITLREDVGRSTYRFTLVISDLTPPEGMGALVEGMMKNAKWADGTYHYSCSGTLERPRGCTEQRERSRTSTRTTTPRPSPRSTNGRRTSTRSPGTAAGGSNNDELREKMRQRREERERLQKEREREEQEAEELEDLGYDDELEEIGYEEAEEAFEDFFENEIPIEDLEQAFEEAFQE